MRVVPTMLSLLMVAGCGERAASVHEPESAPEAATPKCEGTSSSNLPGVRIVFPEQPCTFSLAEAAAGIEVGYDVVIDAPLAGVATRPQDLGGASLPGKSGLNVFEELSGGGQRFCVCDTGLGANEEVSVNLVAGTFHGSFRWTGRNWSGPSDTGFPMGLPFPAGEYELQVRAVGSYHGAEYRVCASFPVRLAR